MSSPQIKVEPATEIQNPHISIAMEMALCPEDAKPVIPGSSIDPLPKHECIQGSITTVTSAPSEDRKPILSSESIDSHHLSCQATPPRGKDSQNTVEDEFEDENEKRDRLRHQEKLESAQRLVDKAEMMEKVVEFMRHMQTEFLSRNSYYIPEFLDWVEDIDTMFANNEIPRILLGMMGDSGCGKSTAINCIIGFDVLPRSGSGEACTSVPVEVRYNVNADPEKAFRADISMVSAEEWRSELETLLRHILSSDEGTIDLSSDDAKAAAAKIKCVYPSLDIGKLNQDSVANLMASRDLQQRFGMTESIEFEDDKQFAKNIAQYIDGSSLSKKGSKDSCLWPLVKKVIVYLRSDVLRTGLAFVDLPGLGDSNEAREMVTQQYMTEVSAICIVADIKRAITNAVAKNLHATSMKRKIRRSGLLDEEHTFFLLTRTDDIEVQEILRSFNFTGQILLSIEQTENIRLRKNQITNDLNIISARIAGIEEGVLKWGKQKTNWEQSLRKRKESGAVSSPDEDQTKRKIEIVSDKIANAQTLLQSQMLESARIKIQISKTENDLEVLETEVSKACIRKRNEHIRDRVRIDFKAGVQERQHQQDEEASGPESEFFVPQSPSQNIKGAQSFCISSRAFQKLMDNEKPLPGFPTIDDTNIPQLVKYCQEFTLGAREKQADDLLKDTITLQKGMEQWADNTTPDVQLTRVQRSKVEEFIDFHITTRNKSMLDIVGDRVRVLRIIAVSNRKTANAKIIPKAVLESRSIVDGWKEDITNSLTWKAVCRKRGVHSAKLNGDVVDIDWNQDLSDILVDGFGDLRKHLATVTLSGLGKTCRADMAKVIQTFNQNLQHDCVGVTTHISNALMHYFGRCQQNERKNFQFLEHLFAMTGNCIKPADDRVLNTIKEAMLEGYEKSLMVKAEPKQKRRSSARAAPAKSLAQLSKDAISDHVSENNDMFTEAGENYHNFIDERIDDMENRLNKFCKEDTEWTRKSLSAMVEHTSKTPRHGAACDKKKYQQEVFTFLRDFSFMLAELKETQHLRAKNREAHKEDIHNGKHCDESLVEDGSSDLEEIEEFEFEKSF